MKEWKESKKAILYPKKERKSFMVLKREISSESVVCLLNSLDSCFAY